MAWKSALDANYAAEELDGAAPSGSGVDHVCAVWSRWLEQINELAARSKVTHGSGASFDQEALEDARLVKRKQCAEDGRATRVWLTQRGRDLEPRMRALHERNLTTLVRVLGKEDAAKLGALLGRLIEGLSADAHSMPQTPAVTSLTAPLKS